MNCYHTIISLLLLVHVGCTEPMLEKTKDFNPVTSNYDFFIEGEIDNIFLRYRQINDPTSHHSNKYFQDHKQTWLQAYVDSITEVTGYWTIRLTELDITSLEFPYVLNEDEGGVAWYDQRVDLLVENSPYCQGIDSRCTFVLKSGLNRITLTSNDNNILEGNFSGKAIITGIGMTPYSNEALFHEITHGKFRIKYQVE